MTIEPRQRKTDRPASLHSAIDVIAVLSIVLFGIVFRKQLSEQAPFYWVTLATILQYFAVSVSFRRAASGWARAVAAGSLITAGFAVLIFAARGVFAPEATDMFLALCLVCALPFFVLSARFSYFFFGQALRNARRSFKKAGAE